MTAPYIKLMTKELEDRIKRNLSLNIDSFIIPSPYVADESLEKDYSHSYVWEEEREILGFLETWANPTGRRLHIYRHVTSPFGRGKGIGSAFLVRLAAEAPSQASIEVYVWERQTEILAFYKRRGFKEQERVSWQALSFNRLTVEVAVLKDALSRLGVESGAAEELGKIRHDAKKAIRLIADMAGALSAENCSRIIEDINRETTALVNTLNLFRDSVQRFRTVNLKELIIDRIVPMIDHSPVPCELKLSFAPGIGEARAHYMDAGRALVNLVSNALDAIRQTKRPGILSIALEESAGWIVLSVEDNGIGISTERLVTGKEGLPCFVGVTTKGESGEGQGTRQIYAAFGVENISVRSESGRGTRWTIRVPKAQVQDERVLNSLETRLTEFKALVTSVPGKDPDRIAIFIGRSRKLEILLWDLILHFARNNNVRDLYRLFLSLRHGAIKLDGFKKELESYKTDIPELRRWLLETARLVLRADSTLDSAAPLPSWGGLRFLAYGQVMERTVIFTLNPNTGAIGITDRKLAEHADFIPYMGESREKLLRGEFFGNINNPANPIQLGVWEIGDAEDAKRKAALIREGARKLISMSVPAEKKLLFYEATWRRGQLDLDTGRPRTLETVASLEDRQLDQLFITADDEFGEYITTD